MRAARLFAWLICLSASASTAVAAPEAQGDEAKRALAEVPSALQTLHELENRLIALEREVARLTGARAADPDVLRTVDALRSEVAEVDRRLAEAVAHASFERVTTSPLGYDDGISLRLPPLRFLLNADLQVRYTGVLRPQGQQNSSDFDLHHARIWLTTTLLDLVDVRLMLDFGSPFVGDGRFAPLRDAYAEVRPLPWLRLRAGQFRTPFSREQLVDDARLTFIDRSLATRAFAPERDLGALVEGRFFAERLLVQAAVTDGIHAGLQAHNDNLDLAYTARVVAQPLGPLPLIEGDPARTRPWRFSVGGAFHYDLQPTDQAPPFNDLDRNRVLDNVEVISAGAEVAVHFWGFAFEGEYYFRRERAGGGQPARNRHGGYAQVSAMLYRGLQLAARYSYAEPHTLHSTAKLGILDEDFRSGQEATGLISWSFWRENIKAQLEYDFRDDAPSDPIDQRVHRGHVLGAQLQAGF